MADYPFAKKLFLTMQINLHNNEFAFPTKWKTKKHGDQWWHKVRARKAKAK